MKIGYFIHDLEMQGSQLSAMQLAQGIKKSLENAEIEIFTKKNGPLIAHANEKKIPVKLINQNSSKDKYSEEANYLRIKKFDLIHVNTILGYEIIICAWLLNIPCVWNIRESIDPKKYLMIIQAECKKDIKFILKKMQIIFVSQQTQRLWNDYLGENNYNIINNSIDTAEIDEIINNLKINDIRINLGIKQESIVLLTVGTLCQRKNQIEILNLYNSLEKNTRNKITLIFVGADPIGYKEKMINYMKINSIEKEKVKFYEVLEVYNRIKLWEFYKIADIFILPSINESYPRVILEAMHFGLPVISTNIYGVKTQLENYQLKCMYESGNLIQLRSIISPLVILRKKREEYSIQSKKVFNLINNYEKMLKQYLDLYNKYHLSYEIKNG